MVSEGQYTSRISSDGVEKQHILCWDDALRRGI